MALLLECSRRPKGIIGLGLGGAIAINLCGGVVLAMWLASGKLMIPLHGLVFLWSLVVLLFGISVTELCVCHRQLADSRRQSCTLSGPKR